MHPHGLLGYSLIQRTVTLPLCVGASFLELTRSERLAQVKCMRADLRLSLTGYLMNISNGISLQQTPIITSSLYCQQQPLHPSSMLSPLIIDLTTSNNNGNNNTQRTFAAGWRKLGAQQWHIKSSLHTPIFITSTTMRQRQLSLPEVDPALRLLAGQQPSKFLKNTHVTLSQTAFPLPGRR